MKNKKCTITLLLCTLLPTTLYGMRLVSRPKPIKLPSTTPVIRAPQPTIESSPIKTTTTTIPNEKPQKLPTFMDPSKTTKVRDLTKPQREQNLISLEDPLKHYKALAEEAQKYDLKIAQFNPKTNKYKYIEYNNLIKQIEKKIEQEKDFSEEEIVNITQVFDVLKAKIKLKKLIITLDDLIIKAQKEDIADKDLQEFKQLTQIDINSLDEVIDIFKEKADEQIKALENLIEKQQAAKELKLAEKAAEQKAAEEQTQLEEEKLKMDQLYEEIEKEFADEQQMEQKRIAAEAKIKEIEQEKEQASASQKEQQNLQKEITEGELTLKQIERAQQERKKAIEELQKEGQNKQAELDLQTQKEIEAHTTQQDIEAARRKKELERIQADKQQAEKEAEEAAQKAQEEEQKTKSDLQAIEQDEAKLSQLKNKEQIIQQDMQNAKTNFAQQKQTIETKAQTELDQLNQETNTKIQEAKDNLQKSQDFIVKSNAEQTAELEALETKYKEEATIKQQSLQTEKDQQLKRINEKYEQELKLIEAEERRIAEEKAREQAQKILEAERAKAEERKKEEENREKERQENQKEEPKKEEKVEGSGDGKFPQKIKPERPEPEEKTDEEKKGKGKLGAGLLIGGAILGSAGEEKEKTEATVLPIIPEGTPTQEETEPRSTTIEEPLEQATEEPIYQNLEQPTYYPTGSSAGKTAGRPTPSSTSTSQGQTPSSFAPSPSYGGGTPSSAESIGWTSSDRMNPYTQRIEWQKNFASKEGATATEIERQKKVQLQDKVWWENILPQWVVQYLGRKDRSIKEKPTAEKPAPITSPEEEKIEKPQPGIVQTFIETIKEPIANTISYIRGLFYG